jgi:hypothetical protein
VRAVLTALVVTAGARAPTRQLDRLVALGYPALAGLSEAELRALASGLEPPGQSVVERSGVSRVLVVSQSLGAPARVVPAAEVGRLVATGGAGLHPRAGGPDGDRRVLALWISGGAPKLGWCWDGNPHDWLGVASAGGRLG